MNQTVTTKTELMDFIRSKIPAENFKNPISIFFRPKTGWKYEVIIPVTNVLEEDDVIWISNAFSHEQPQLTMQQLMSKLLECENDKQVIIEVYGYNGECNDQFIYSQLSPLEDIDVLGINDVIYFWINIDKISTYPTT
jgi:hypothetical protein